MYRSEVSLACGTVCILAVVCWSSVVMADTVNVDFNGYRAGDALGTTYVGPFGASTSATAVWNGLAANSMDNGDMLTVAGSNLLNDAGTATSIGLSVTPVGGDRAWGSSTLFEDYIFCNAAGNVSQNPTFTISGLGENAKADVYVYTQVNATSIATISFGGVTGVRGGNDAVLYFKDVPVVNGTAIGHMATDLSTVNVVYGMSVVTPVPEPSTLLLMATSVFGMLAYAWRKRK